MTLGLIITILVLVPGGILLFVVGLSYPGVRGFVVQMQYRKKHRRDFKRLEPLWTLLTTAAPEVVLDAEGLAAAAARQEGLEQISRERVG